MPDPALLLDLVAGTSPTSTALLSGVTGSPDRTHVQQLMDPAHPLCAACVVILAKAKTLVDAGALQAAVSSRLRPRLVT